MLLSTTIWLFLLRWIVTNIIRLSGWLCLYKSKFGLDFGIKTLHMQKWWGGGSPGQEFLFLKWLFLLYLLDQYMNNVLILLMGRAIKYTVQFKLYVFALNCVMSRSNWFLLFLFIFWWSFLMMFLDYTLYQTLSLHICISSSPFPVNIYYFKD